MQRADLTDAKFLAWKPPAPPSAQPCRAWRVKAVGHEAAKGLYGALAGGNGGDDDDDDSDDGESDDGESDAKGEEAMEAAWGDAALSALKAELEPLLAGAACVVQTVDRIIKEIKERLVLVLDALQVSSFVTSAAQELAKLKFDEREKRLRAFFFALLKRLLDHILNGLIKPNLQMVLEMPASLEAPLTTCEALKCATHAAFRSLAPQSTYPPLLTASTTIRAVVKLRSSSEKVAPMLDSEGGEGGEGEGGEGEGDEDEGEGGEGEARAGAPRKMAMAIEMLVRKLLELLPHLRQAALARVTQLSETAARIVARQLHALDDLGLVAAMEAGGAKVGIVGKVAARARARPPPPPPATAAPDAVVEEEAHSPLVEEAGGATEMATLLLRGLESSFVLRDQLRSVLSRQVGNTVLALADAPNRMLALANRGEEALSKQLEALSAKTQGSLESYLRKKPLQAAAFRAVSSQATKYSVEMGTWSGSLKQMKMALGRSRVKLNVDENELTYLLDKLEKLEELNTTTETWKDVAETWMALFKLRSQMQVERGITILNCIISDTSILKALGMAKALLDIEGDPPTAVVRTLGQSAGKHIRHSGYRYRKQIKYELALIGRVKELQSRGIGLLGTAFVALFISTFNYMYRAVYEAYRNDQVFIIVFPVALVLGVVLLIAAAALGAYYLRLRSKSRLPTVE